LARGREGVNPRRGGATGAAGATDFAANSENNSEFSKIGAILAIPGSKFIVDSSGYTHIR
jgi:hypothetical protein